MTPWASQVDTNSPLPPMQVWTREWRGAGGACGLDRRGGKPAGAIILDWTAGAASYTLWRSTNSTGPFSVVAAGLTTTSYADTNAVNGAVNYCQVVARYKAAGI